MFEDVKWLILGGGGTNGEKWGIYFMGNRVNRLGNSPFSPFFQEFYLLFIDQYFRVEVKEHDIRLIRSV